MLQKLIAFFMSIVAFFTGLFGGGKKSTKPEMTVQEYSGYVYGQNISYGKDERHLMDMALPADAAGKTIGLVLLIHGGAWIAGSKDIFSQDYLASFARSGYAVAAISYRYLSDSVHMEDLMDDVEAALRMIKYIGAIRGINIEKCLLTGGSAGAHMSLLYAYSRQQSAPIRPVAVVSNCGPTDLTIPAQIENSAIGSTAKMLELVSWATGVTLSEKDYNKKNSQYEKVMAAARAESPLYYADTAVPTVIAHGEKDSVVPYSGAVALDKALTARNIRHDFVSFPNSDHGLDRDPDCTMLVNQLLVQYAAEYLN